MQQEIRLKLKAFNSQIIDKATLDIIAVISRINKKFRGPIPLPNRVLKFIVNKSPHVYKKSREQFEIRHHTRLIIINSSTEIVDALMKLNIAFGVDIQVKING